MVHPLLVMRGDINAKLMLTGHLFQRKPSKIKVKSGARLVGKHYPIEHESRRKCCNRSCKVLGENCKNKPFKNYCEKFVKFFSEFCLEIFHAASNL